MLVFMLSSGVLGFCVWLKNMEGFELRTTTDVYMNEMQNFTTYVVDMMKEEKLFATQRGPIILAQIENEYGNTMEPYGDDGVGFLDWAELQNIVPWIMCQQCDTPAHMVG